jgi:DNA-binding NarL/FixJ family response regulator
VAEPGRVRIILADDQPLQRQGFRMILDSQPDFTVVGEASDGDQVLALARAVATDVVLMDIQMPRMDGIATAARLVSDRDVLTHGRSPRVILLTAVDVDDHLAAAAVAGVFAVMFKDTDPENLLAAIRSAADGVGEPN